MKHLALCRSILSDFRNKTWRWTCELDSERPFRISKRFISSLLQRHFYGVGFHQVSSKGLQFDGLCRWARREKTLEDQALRVQHHWSHSEQHGRTSFNTHHDLRFLKHNSNAFSLRFFSQNLIFQSDKKSFQWLLCAGFAFETSWLSFGVHRSERSEPENQSCPTCQSPPAALPRLEIFRSGRPRRRPEQLWAINSVEFGAGWGQSWLLRVLINFIPKQHSDSIRKNAHLIDLWYCHMNEDRHQLIKDRRNDEDAGSLKQQKFMNWQLSQSRFNKFGEISRNANDANDAQMDVLLFPALKENNSSRPEAYGIVT